MAATLQRTLRLHEFYINIKQFKYQIKGSSSLTYLKKIKFICNTIINNGLIFYISIKITYSYRIRNILTFKI